MGLTFENSKKKHLVDLFNIKKKDNEHVIALAGNPNTGKSTVFNSLTGLNQHTGNWPGKTVVNARGNFKYNEKDYILIDVPGTYSLFANSNEEIVARDFICFGDADATFVVTDATCLERNLNLLFQVMELTHNVILIVNLIDEARRKAIEINKLGLELSLGIPVVFTAARSGEGINCLKDTLDELITTRKEQNPLIIHYSDETEILIKEVEGKLSHSYFKRINRRWLALRIIDGNHEFFESMNHYFTKEEYSEVIELNDEYKTKVNREAIREEIIQSNYREADIITKKYVKESKDKFKRDQKIDNIVTSRKFGIPIMLLLLAGIFYLTIQGANVPSQLLATALFKVEEWLMHIFNRIHAPSWITGLLVTGVYRSLAWVISVMLPPMAIFFPIFTLLEDLGYLPRVAYNLDHLFKKARAHGKQCLSMCMGFGCNAAGVIGTRIIDSPREKLIAIITNTFVPCNGRFPTLIAIATIFFATTSYSLVNGIIPALSITGVIILGVLMTLAISNLLSHTILKGMPSTFTLELPPYRRPQVGRVIYTSIIDRTIFVLVRAIIVAIPAGAIVWIFGNTFIGDISIIQHAANFFDPYAKPLGLDGIILLAFVLGLPANEIVLPIILMAYLSTKGMIELDSLSDLKEVLVNNGWTWLTALNVMLFSLFHWPCSTTLWTIKKETNSWKWTFVCFILPTVLAIIVCFITTQTLRLFI